MLIYIHNKRLRPIFEAASISLCNSLNTHPDFYKISPYLRKSILDSYNIFHIYHSFICTLFYFYFSASFWFEIFLYKQTNIDSTQYF